MNEEELLGCEKELTRCEAVIKQICEMMYDKYKGRVVILNTGKYKGREARIDAVIPWGDGTLCFLCMVLRCDGQGVLNSDGESRTYRPRTEFQLTRVQTTDI